MNKAILLICAVVLFLLYHCDNVINTSDNQSSLQSSLLGNWLDTVIVNDTTNLIDPNGNHICYLALSLGKPNWSFAMSVFDKSNGNRINETYFIGKIWTASADSLILTGSWKYYDSTNTIIDSSTSISTYYVRYQKVTSRQLTIWNYIVAGQQQYKLQ